MFADKRVKVSRLPSFRAEHFPYSGPYPWLDRPDALEQIDNKLRDGAITEEEARQCRYWADNGYIIVEKLIEDRVLDAVWDAYEGAIREGKIRLEAEPASADDPYPGRFLNPHKKSGAYCQILKHPALLRWIQVLMEREPKPLQNHHVAQRFAAECALGLHSHDDVSHRVFERGVDRFRRHSPG